MARRGRFGRYRSGGSNLTALIAALLREQRQAEDRAIFDAYKNGGLYKGEAVTDARLLAYIEGRRNSFASNDPLYDEWNNTLIQTRFSIEEQKIALRFKEGKASASQVAAFYRGQLASIPKDSQFYREVAGRAADWAEQARNAARSAAKNRLTKAYNAAVEDAVRTTAAYGAVEQSILDAAQRAGFGVANVRQLSATQLAQVFAGGVIGPDGKAISLDSWRQMAAVNLAALDAIVTQGVKAGLDPKDLERARAQRQEFIETTVIPQNVLDQRGSYESLARARDDALDAANGDPYAVQRALDAYRSGLVALRDNLATSTEDEGDAFLGAVTNELGILDGKPSTGPSVEDLFGGGYGGDPGQGSEQSGGGTADMPGADTAAGLAANVAYATDGVDLLSTGKGYWGQIAPGGPMTVAPYPFPADPTGRGGLPEAYQHLIVTVGGVPREVIIAGTPVQQGVVVDQEGNLVTNYTQADLDQGLYEVRPFGAAGYIWSYESGGEVRNLYGLIQPDGSIRYTNSNPFIGMGPQGTEGGGILLAPEPGVGTVIRDVTTTSLPLDLGTPPQVLANLVRSGKLDVNEEQAREIANRAERERRDIANQRGIRTGKPTPELKGGAQQFVRGGATDAPSTAPTVPDIIRSSFGVPLPFAQTSTEAPPIKPFSLSEKADYGDMTSILTATAPTVKPTLISPSFGLEDEEVAYINKSTAPRTTTTTTPSTEGLGPVAS